MNEDDTPVERLVAVIRYERERLDAEIETLQQRKTQSVTALPFWNTSPVSLVFYPVGNLDRGFVN